MPVRFISKGKGRNRKAFPIKPKRGVTVRSVSLRPSSVAKINKEQIKLLRRNEPATFSKALNQVVMRAKKLSIPIYDTHVNEDGIRKPYHMWISDMKKHKKVKGSDTLVLAEHYGQAVDDFITIWNKEHRMDKDIGYPVVEGTGLNPIKNQDFFLTEDSTMRKAREPEGSTVFSGMGLFDIANKIGKWEGQMGYRGMKDVWEHKKTGDRLVIEPYEDTPPERMGKDFEGEEEVWVHDKDTGNHDSLFIGSPSEALSFANMWMRENKEGWE